MVEIEKHMQRSTCFSKKFHWVVWGFRITWFTRSSVFILLSVRCWGFSSLSWQTGSQVFALSPQVLCEVTQGPRGSGSSPAISTSAPGHVLRGAHSDHRNDFPVRVSEPTSHIPIFKAAATSIWHSPRWAVCQREQNSTSHFRRSSRRMNNDWGISGSSRDAKRRPFAKQGSRAAKSTMLTQGFIQWQWTWALNVWS